MIFDLHPDEATNDLNRFQLSNEPPAPGMFHNFLPGAAQYTAKGLTEGLKSLAIIGGGALAQDPLANAVSNTFKKPGDVSLSDSWFKTVDEAFQPAIDKYTPKPDEVGVAGQITGQIASTLLQAAVSPALAVATAEAHAGTEAITKGASVPEAAGLGAVEGASTALGLWMPILGKTYAQRVLIGGGGANVVNSVVTQGYEQLILAGKPELAKEFEVTMSGLGIQGLMGLAFGHLPYLPGMKESREHGAAVWDQIANKVRDPSPTELAAMAVLREAQHKNLDSLSGRPATAADVGLHIDAFNKVFDDLANNRTPSVDGMKMPDVDQTKSAQAPDGQLVTGDLASHPAEDAMPTRAQQDAEVVKTIQEVAPQVAADEGIEPPYFIAKTAEQQMLAAGRSPEEATALGHLHEALFQRIGQETGVGGEVAHRKYMNEITNRPPADGSLEQPNPVFHSELQRQLTAAPIKAAPAKEWSNYIKGLSNKGVKADEVKWSGLEDWLAAQPGKVTKEQMQDFLSKGGVQVQEVTLGAPTEPTNVAAMREEFQGLSDRSEGRGQPLSDAERERMDSLSSELFNHPNPHLAGDNTKFSTYQLPGGENYKELLLALPSDTPPAEHNTAYYKETTEDFKSSHFDQPNILAHVRFNERTDADGKKVLFIEEVQSDWGQAGKKSGFKEKMTEAQTKRLEELDRIPDDKLSEADRKEYEKLVTMRDSNVPAGPFVGKTEAWVALSLKRMIRYAAENGFDRVAWTTGEQQAARYDMSKQVDSIKWKPLIPAVGEGAMVRITPTGGEPISLQVGKDGKVMASQRGGQFEGKDLSDVIGKELAEKVAGSEKGTLAGEGLKIGGEGMKAFYDKIIPNVANDVLKKLGGGRVEASDMTTPRGKPTDYADFHAYNATPKEVNSTQMGFKITPEMKAKALQSQPLFQEGQRAPRGYLSIDEAGKMTMGLLEQANASTALHETGHIALELINDLAQGSDPGAEWAGRHMDSFLKWAGVKDRAAWDGMDLDARRPYHEKFARGFEQYLREGNAPTKGLKALFQQFRDWLIQVYQHATDLNVKISDEMRALYGDLLTSKEQDPTGVNRVEGQVAESEAVPPPPAASGESPGPSAPKTEGEKVDPMHAEADLAAAKMPSLPAGVDTKGETVRQSAAEYLEAARAEAAEMRKKATLFEVAANCAMGKD